MRALIHSSQHGKGKWVNSSKLYDHKKTELSENYDGNNLSTTLSHYDQEVVDLFKAHNITSDSIGKNFNVGKYPNIYQIPTYYPFKDEQDLEAAIQLVKNQNSDDKTVENELHLKIQNELNLRIDDLNNETSPDLRAVRIGFIKLSNVGNESQEELLIDDPAANANALKMDHAEIPAALDGMKSIGFFLDITEKDEFSSSMEVSEKAVLFETPNARPLVFISISPCKLKSLPAWQQLLLGNSYSLCRLPDTEVGQELITSSKLHMKDLVGLLL